MGTNIYYTTVCAISHLKDDPTLVLKSTIRDSMSGIEELNLYVSKLSQGLICKEVSTGNLHTIPMNAQWYEIDFSVSFEKAVEAFSNGSIIYCVDDSGEVNHYPHHSYNICHNLIDEKGHPVTADEILKCKWYIRKE